MQMSGLSEILLRDLRVLDSTTYIIEIGDGSAANILSNGRCVLHAMLKGSAEIRVAGGDTSLHFKPGDTATCFYGDPHRLAVGSDEAPITLSLDGVETPKEEIKHILVPDTLAPSEERTTILSTVFSFAHVSPAAYSIRAGPSLWRMEREDCNGTDSALAFNPEQILADCEGPGSRGVVAAFANLMLIRSIRNTHRSMLNHREMPVWAPNARRIASALLAIHAQPEREWTVAILAREVGLSRSCFASGFAAEVGMTPIAYLNQVRMKRAAQLLQDDRFAIAEVSRRVGYLVPSSFTRAFTSYHGVSPSLFAQQADTATPTCQ